jgi:TIR domain
MQIAESLDSAHRVAALYTPHYWSSPACKDEFTAALARQNDIGDAVLFPIYPIYVLSTQIPYLSRNLQYVDCREGDTTKLAQACLELARML